MRRGTQQQPVLPCATWLFSLPLLVRCLCLCVQALPFFVFVYGHVIDLSPAFHSFLAHPPLILHFLSPHLAHLTFSARPLASLGSSWC